MYIQKHKLFKNRRALIMILSSILGHENVAVILLQNGANFGFVEHLRAIIWAARDGKQSNILYKLYPKMTRVEFSA